MQRVLFAGVWAEANALAAFQDLIEQRFGLRLAENQMRSLSLRIPQLVLDTDTSDAAELVRALATGWRSDLLDGLVGDLTIGETHFFRVQQQVEALRQVVLPELLERHAETRRLRIWSAGCSTGEEPFTLAILLREQLLAHPGWEVDLVASDISGPGLESAKRAAYGEWSFRDTPPAVRNRYFDRVGDHWQLCEPVRRMVRFTRVNLLLDPFPGADGGRPDFDLIVCRHVTIYFTPDATQRVYQRFVESLAPDGWLVLGPSDPTPAQPGSLTPVFLPGAVLWRKASAPARADHPTPRFAGWKPPSSNAAAARSVRDRVDREPPAPPRSAESHLTLGMRSLDEGNLEQALLSLRRAVFLEPGNPLAQFSLGRAWVHRGDPDRARAGLVQARRLLSNVPDDVHIGGGTHLKAGALRYAIQAQLSVLQKPKSA